MFSFKIAFLSVNNLYCIILMHVGRRKNLSFLSDKCIKKIKFRRVIKYYVIKN